MLDTRQTLTTLLTNAPDLIALGVTIIQEDEFDGNTQKPTIVITYADGDPVPDSHFRQESWDLWLVVESGDYYTLGQIGKAVRNLLNLKTPSHGAGMDSTVLRFDWTGEGPAVLDQMYRVHTQVQSYNALVFDVS